MYARSRLLIIGLTFAIAACTTLDNKFDPDRVDELKPGISTIADATAILGPPAFQSPDRDGSRLLQWHYTKYQHSADFPVLISGYCLTIPVA